MRVAVALLLASLTLGANAATAPSGTAPDISGTWQGMLRAPASKLRIVFQISRDSGAWKATMYSLDEMPDQFPATAVSLTGSSLKIRVDLWHATYEGTVSADGSSINGTWTQGSPASLDPHAGLPVRKGTSGAEAAAQDEAAVEAQIAALRRDDPSAQVVRLPHASHYVFISNEAEVLRDVRAFIDTLPAHATQSERL